MKCRVAIRVAMDTRATGGMVAIRECVDIVPDKYTMCTNLPLILYHYNNKVCAVNEF
jgi:hypothetical protein